MAAAAAAVNSAVPIPRMDTLSIIATRVAPVVWPRIRMSRSGTWAISSRCHSSTLSLGALSTKVICPPGVLGFRSSCRDAVNFKIEGPWPAGDAYKNSSGRVFLEVSFVDSIDCLEMRGIICVDITFRDFVE
jgi:hypothetical protein